VESPIIKMQNRVVALFVAPALFIYLAFFVLPTLGTVVLSLFNWSGPGTPLKFIGLGNYRTIMHDPVYQSSLKNTLIILVVLGVIVFTLSFLMALALYKLPARRFLRTVIFFPNVVPAVALSVVWVFLLTPEFGLLDHLLDMVGLGFLAQPWLSPSLIFPSILAAIAWVQTGFFTILLLSGVERIPNSYFEAADLEGASEFQRFRYVTLPMMWDIFGISVIIWITAAIKTFDFIYVLAGVGGDPPPNVWTLAVQMYIVSFSARTPIYTVGYGSAIAVTMILLVLVSVTIARRLMRREGVEY
jgi:raffinose/stachyose/melibiose transport system permease protein